MIKDALIIAAGRGSRLDELTQKSPKPMTKLCGLSLIERIMHSAYQTGIENFYITVGYKADVLINFLKSKKYPFNITFIKNEKWELSNGYSVYSAKNYLEHKNFVLLMSDHIFDKKNLEKLIFYENKLENNYNKNGFISILASDFNKQSGIDINDATKIIINNNLITEINKNLTNYDAYDTGMFLCSKNIFKYFDILNESKKDFSLSEANSLIIKDNKFSYCDIDKNYWQDIDTKVDLKTAENKLLNTCRKDSDGIISRNFNRYISLFITKKIINTNITPNQMTLFVLLIGIISSLLIIKLNKNFNLFSYFLFVIGLLLYKLSSIMDGCDGEIAKLKFMSSKYGAWLDTICDNLTTLLFLSAISFNLYSFNSDQIVIAISSPLLFFIAVSLLMFYLARKQNTGTLITVNKIFHKNKLFYILANLVKRDFFTLVFIILASFLMFKEILILNLIFSFIIIVSTIYLFFKKKFN